MISHDTPKVSRANSILTSVRRKKGLMSEISDNSRDNFQLDARSCICREIVTPCGLGKSRFRDGRIPGSKLDSTEDPSFIWACYTSNH
ncbi:hypothetical protein AVEN_127463-1, partial [Araneus ventricosus]